MDIDTQLVSVQGRNVNTRFGAKIVYDVLLGNGVTHQTWKSDIAMRAQGLLQENGGNPVPVSARVSKSQDGKYDNLDDIATPGQLPALAVPGLPPTAVIPIVNSGGGGGRGMDPVREARIVKQSCLSTAFGFIGNLFSGAGPEAQLEAAALALELAKELYSQVYGRENVAQPAQTPEQVAALVNATVGSEAVSVGVVNAPEW